MSLIALKQLVMVGATEAFHGRNDSSTRTASLQICYALTATLLLAAMVLVLLHSSNDSWAASHEAVSSSGQHAWANSPKISSPPSIGGVFGCSQAFGVFEDCWAGVYVDSVAGMALHLHEGGRAFQSPGAEVAISGSDGTVRCQLWWRADEDTLRMVDCTGLPFRWPGAADDLLRDPPRPGRLAGFSVGGDVGIASIGDSPSGNDSMLNAESFGEVSLVRDPSGFLFPGCMYALYLRGGSSSSCGARGARGVGDVDFRVVLGADGGLTHGASGERIATLSYAPPRLSTVGSSGAINSGASGAWWATGHAIVLRLMVKHREGQGDETLGPSLTLVLSSSDGGRTWLSTTGCAKLSLVISPSVSMFPVTAAMSLSVSYLSDADSKLDGPAQARSESEAAEHAVFEPSLQLQPIVEVFQAQPLVRSGSWRRGAVRGELTGLLALVVISREVTRPKEREELSCFINGAERRAVWLSWSMVLCSSARVAPGEATLHLTFKNRRISTDFTFVHAPSPRHTRLAWPNSEAFGVLRPTLSRQTQFQGVGSVGGGVLRDMGVDVDVDVDVDVKGVGTSDALVSRGRGRGREDSSLTSGTSIVLCTMFKNEAPYLEEWLEYHRLLGVSKVYMYDNGSSDGSRKILKRHQTSGFVQVRDWHHRGAQTEALNDCLCRFRHTSEWMSFIDIDEFIDPAPGLPIQAVVEQMMDQMDQRAKSDVDLVELEGHDHGHDHGRGYPYLYPMTSRRKSLMEHLDGSWPSRHTHCMPWVNYCSSGQLSKPKGGVLESFLQVEAAILRSTDTCYILCTTDKDMGERKIHMQKPIFRAMEALTLRRIGPHFLLYASEDIDSQYKRNLRCPYEWLDKKAFQVRHYRSKSLQEYVDRRTGADAAYKGRRYTKDTLTSEWKAINAACRTGN